MEGKLPSAASAAGTRTKVHRPGTVSLASSLLHEHRTSYTVVVLAVIAASALTSAWTQVTIAARMGDGLPDSATLNAYSRLLLQETQEVAKQLSITAACLCGFISIFLVVTSVGFLIERRRREYALMRLAGAAPGQVRRLSLLEFMIPLGLADLLGSAVGCLLVPAFAKSLTDSGLEELTLVARPHPLGAVISFVGILLSCLVGAWFAARRITSVSPIEAMQTPGNRAASKSVGPLRLIIALVGLAGGLILVFHDFHDMDSPSQILAASACLLVAVGALAPALVSVCANLFGLPFQFASQGSGLLARQRARKETRSSTAIALPVILMLVIMTGLLSLARVGWATDTSAQYKPASADVLVTAGADRTAELDRRIRSSSDVDSAVTYSKDEWKFESDGTGTGDDAEATDGFLDLTTMHFNKSGRAASTLGPVFIKGSLADLGPGRAAVTPDWPLYHDGQDPIGRTVTLVDRNDKRHRITITAVVDPSRTGQRCEYLSTDTGLAGLAPDPRGLTTLIRANQGVQVDDLVNQLNDSWGHRDIRARTKKDHIRYSIGRSQEVQRALPKMVEGAVVLTSIFLIQSCVIAISERRNENRRMHAAGVSRGTLVRISVWESVIDTLSATFLSALVMVGVLAIIVRAMKKSSSDMSMIPLPYDYFLIMALCALALAALVSWLYGWFSSRADRTRR